MSTCPLSPGLGSFNPSSPRQWFLVAKSLYSLCKDLHKPCTGQPGSGFNRQKYKDLHAVCLDCHLLLYSIGRIGPPMCLNLPDRVEEHRAAVLLGLPATELRRFSRSSGIGHLEESDQGPEMVFTYEELRRLCLLAAQSSK